jgi:hypothetical protein
LYLVSMWVGAKVKRLLYNVCLTTSRKGTQVYKGTPSRTFGNPIK